MHSAAVWIPKQTYGGYHDQWKVTDSIYWLLYITRCEYRNSLSFFLVVSVSWDFASNILFCWFQTSHEGMEGLISARIWIPQGSEHEAYKLRLGSFRLFATYQFRFRNDFCRVAIFSKVTATESCNVGLWIIQCQSRDHELPWPPSIPVAVLEYDISK